MSALQIEPEGQLYELIQQCKLFSNTSCSSSINVQAISNTSCGEAQEWFAVNAGDENIVLLRVKNHLAA